MRDRKPRHGYTAKDIIIVVYLTYPLISIYSNLLIFYYVNLRYSASIDAYCNLAWPFNERYQTTLTLLGISESEIHRVKIIFANSSVIMIIVSIIRILLQIRNPYGSRMYYVGISKSKSIGDFFKFTCGAFILLLGIFIMSDFSESKNLHAWNVHRPLFFALAQAMLFMYGMYWSFVEALGVGIYKYLQT